MSDNNNIIPKERRKTMRIPVLNGKQFLVEQKWTLLDVSEGGAFIETDEDIHPKDTEAYQNINILLPGDLGILNLKCEVVRIAWRTTKKQKKGFAIKWSPMEPGIKKIFDAWLVYIRNKQIIDVSKRIIEEFFGKNKPEVTV